MTKKEKRMLRRIIIAFCLFVLALPLHYKEALFDATGWTFFTLPALKYIELPMFLIAYIIVGRDIVFKAARNIKNGAVFDENFLMTIATFGAFALGESAEGVAVMLFFQVGELFQSYSVSRSRRSIASLMDIRPDYANILVDGEITEVDPDDVHIGDEIIIKPGERVPLDGVIKSGSSSLDTSSLTGESAPRDVLEGDDIISGCINLSGVLTVTVTKEFGQSTVMKILELVENASDKKSKSENFITRFARYYTPGVVIGALALAIITPLATGQPFGIWVHRALTFLVISCPCALVISVPLSFFGGIGGASKCGVLIKGSNYLELMAKAETVVFDKTGTLTKGNFVVTDIVPANMSKEELLRFAAHSEHYSTHPIGASIKEAYGKPVDMDILGDVEEIAGHGIKAAVDGSEILAGNARLMEKYGIEHPAATGTGTVVYFAKDGAFAGYILIADQLKPDAAEAIKSLKASGVKQTVMLTGDSEAVGREVAASLGIDKVYASLLPQDKVEKMEQLLAECPPKASLAFVGDGINDAPVLARADVGIAMGGLGSDAAIEAADIVLMTDEPSKIATVMKISRKTLNIVWQNIIFALGVKAVVLVLGAIGRANMWAAVFADVGVSVIAILNAMRAMNVKAFQPKE